MVQATDAIQHAPCNMQRAPCKIQHTPCNMQSYNIQHTPCSMQLTPCNIQSCNITTRTVQRTTHTVQQAILQHNTHHAACDAGHAQPFLYRTLHAVAQALSLESTLLRFSCTRSTAALWLRLQVLWGTLPASVHAGAHSSASRPYSRMNTNAQPVICHDRSRYNITPGTAG